MSVPPDAPIFASHFMRAAEAMSVGLGTSLAELMERAGAAVADTAWRMAAGAPILVLCGPGNNGGDGYVAARLLSERGAAVRVAALKPPNTDLAEAACALWHGPVERLSPETAPAALIVDALFGLGLSRPLSDDLAQILRGFAKCRVLAVDLPSGVDGDGLHSWLPPLPADVTVALGALKFAHVLLPAASACGRVLLAPIGIEPVKRIRTISRPAQYASPAADAHKFSRGMVLVRAGAMPGAAGLAAASALRAGAGYVMLSGADRAPFEAIIAEGADGYADRLRDGRLGAVVLGPGYRAGRALDDDVALALDSGKPLVLDAAAIATALPRLGSSETPVAILTPHEGEFARAFPDIQGDKINRAVEAARRSRAVVVYKGADTIIAAPDGRVVAAWPGSPWLATAGTGDVLAGACGAMLARGSDAFDAAVAAVGWHIACAAHIGPGLVADDLVADGRVGE